MENANLVEKNWNSLLNTKSGRLFAAALVVGGLMGGACADKDSAISATESTTSSTFEMVGGVPIAPEDLPTSDNPRDIIGKLNMIRDIAICGNNYELLAGYYYRSSSNTAYQMDKEYMDNHPDLNCMTISGIRGEPTEVVWGEDGNSLSFNYTVSSPDGSLYDKSMTVERDFPGDNWLVVSVGNL